MKGGKMNFQFSIFLFPQHLCNLFNYIPACTIKYLHIYLCRNLWNFYIHLCICIFIYYFIYAGIYGFIYSFIYIFAYLFILCFCRFRPPKFILYTSQVLNTLHNYLQCKKVCIIIIILMLFLI